MGVSQVKLPYSQPWYKPQLEETLDDLERAKREVSRLKEVIASIAKERDAAFDAGKRSADIIAQKSGEQKGLLARIEAAEEQVESERHAAEEARREKDEKEKELVKLRARIASLSAELEDLRGMMSGYLEDRVKAEKNSAESAVSAAQALAEAKTLRREREEVQKAYTEAKGLADAAAKADKERAQAAAAAAERAETERRARLESRIIKVLPATREFLDEKIVNVQTLSDAMIDGTKARFNEPNSLWSLLESRNYDGQHDAPIVLLSAAWLRTQRTHTRLPERQRLPPEAIIPVRSLRAIAISIEKGMGTMTKPLPIISILHANMKLDGPPAARGSDFTADEGSDHPDPEGILLEKIVDAIDTRWADFTRRRGGTQSTGVTDMGVFVDWSSLYQTVKDDKAPHGKIKVRRRSEHEEKVYRDALNDVHMLYAHGLTTVWIMPDAKAPIGPQLLDYGSAWPMFLRLICSLAKPSNLSENNAWPQLLTLGEDTDGIRPGRDEQEKVMRPAPAEPLVFHPGHSLGHLEGMSEAMIASKWPEILCSALLGMEELDFRRCGWGDEEASWLAIILPMCGRLKRLYLSGNKIGNAGASALAGALSSINLRTLEELHLDNNEIGDPGASALFQRMSPNENGEVILTELKTLSLSNNALNDASVTALAGAIAGGALRGCKKVILDGNPVTKATAKTVKKALKKGPPKK